MCPTLKKKGGREAPTKKCYDNSAVPFVALPKTHSAFWKFGFNFVFEIKQTLFSLQTFCQTHLRYFQFVYSFTQKWNSETATCYVKMEWA